MSKIVIAEQTHKWVERCDELHKENSLLKKENKELKNLLKEIRGKLHYINTPTNQHNIFGNDFMKRLDNLLNKEKEK